MILNEEMIKFDVAIPSIQRKMIGSCRDDALRPKPMTEGAAGYDLRADIEERHTFEPCDQPVLIPTGVRCEIPRDHVGLLTIRSSLARLGLIVQNSPGIIDSDYRGEIMVLMNNLSPYNESILPLQRIAQLVVVRCPMMTSLFTSGLSDTCRGSGGFGSTDQGGDE